MEIVVFTSASEIPRARAFSSSISSWYCGSSLRPLARTLSSSGRWYARSRNLSRAAIRASWPRPAWSCRYRSKPVALPSSSTAGGAKANTRASMKRSKCFCARSARANTLFSLPSRSSHGLSMMKAMPELCPRPAKLKPVTVNTELTAADSSFSRYSRIWSTTFCVRSEVEPAGVCTWANSTPWSSSGRNAVGMRANSQTMPAMITT
ncbi:hypothetical protein D9M71_411270 [compost metagenome]